MKTTTSHKLPTGLLALVCALAASVGCTHDHWKFASWDVRKAVGWKKDKPEPEVPVRIVSTWTEATLNRTGETPKRGFGGRLAFFKADSQDPVRVEGQLVVYAFDETTRPAYETQPTRRYVFPADQLSIYESDSKLGPSYSVWLPWDEAGGPSRKISLIARFEPKGGPVIVGEQTKHLLSGPDDGPPNSNQPQLAGGTPSGGVQQVSYQTQTPATTITTHQIGAGAASAGPLTARETSVLSNTNPLETTTIALPRRVSMVPGAPLQDFRRVQPQRASETPPAGDGATAGQPTAKNAATSTATSTTQAAAQSGENANPYALRQNGALTSSPLNSPATGWLEPPLLQQGRPQLAGFPPSQHPVPTTQAAR